MRIVPVEKTPTRAPEWRVLLDGGTEIGIIWFFEERRQCVFESKSCSLTAGELEEIAIIVDDKTLEFFPAEDTP